MRKVISIVLLMAVMVLTIACTKGNKVKETTLYIESDGKVTEAIVESQEDSDEGELTKWVDDAVKEYNQENKDVLKVKKCEVKDGNAKVTIEYDSLKDYSGFNHVIAYDGTAAEAKEAGYELEGEFISAKGKPSITFMELEDNKEYHILILEDPQTVILEEEVLYASSNVKVDGKQAVIDGTAKGLAYIIYKP